MGYKLIGCFMLMIGVVEGYSAQQGAEQQPDAHKEARDVAESVDIKVQIARWYDGKAAAFSLQFHDQDLSHLKTAIPVLNQYDRHPFV